MALARREFLTCNRRDLLRGFDMASQLAKEHGPPHRRPGAAKLGLAVTLLVAACSPKGSGGQGGTCVPDQLAACACSDGTSGTQVCVADGTFGACSCDRSCKSDIAALVNLGEAMQIQLAEEHTPTDEEMRLAAVFWVFLVVGDKNGFLDPAFLQSGVSEDVAAARNGYPSLFAMCHPSTLGYTKQPLIRSAQDYQTQDCHSNCIPALDLTDVALLGLTEFLHTTLPKQVPYQRWNAWVKKIVGNVSLTKLAKTVKVADEGKQLNALSQTLLVDGAVKKAMGDSLDKSDVEEILSLVGLTVGVGAAAGTVVGLSPAILSALAVAASAAAAAELVNTALNLGVGAAGAYSLRQSCLLFKMKNCAAAGWGPNAGLFDELTRSDASFSPDYSWSGPATCSGDPQGTITCTADLPDGGSTVAGGGADGGTPPAMQDAGKPCADLFDCNAGTEACCYGVCKPDPYAGRAICSTQFTPACTLCRRDSDCHCSPMYPLLCDSCGGLIADCFNVCN
jgi:hypothetical protein